MPVLKTLNENDDTDEISGEKQWLLKKGHGVLN
jgi:hypothetical protein